MQEGEIDVEHASSERVVAGSRGIYGARVTRRERDANTRGVYYQRGTNVSEAIWAGADPPRHLATAARFRSPTNMEPTARCRCWPFSSAKERDQ